MFNFIFTLLLIFTAQLTLGSDGDGAGSGSNKDCPALLQEQTQEIAQNPPKPNDEIEEHLNEALNLLSKILPGPVTYADLTVSTQPMSFTTQESETLATQTLTYAKIKSAIEQFSSENPVRDKRNNDEVQTLIYPAAGFDSAVAFAILPSLTTVIALDNHDFHLGCGSSEIIPVFGPRDVIDCGFTNVGYVDREENLSKVILGRLLAHFPKARIHRVVGILDPIISDTNPDYKELVIRPVPEYSHGVILFDTGPGTPIKTYVHLRSQTSIYSSETYTFDVYKNLAKVPFQAILQKASMAWLDSGSIILPVTRALVGNGGLWIDGDRMESNESLPIHSLRAFFSSWNMNFPMFRQSLPKITGFGYGQVELIQFTPEQKTNIRNLTQTQ